MRAGGWVVGPRSLARWRAHPVRVRAGWCAPFCEANPSNPIQVGDHICEVNALDGRDGTKAMVKELMQCSKIRMAVLRKAS